MKKIYFGIIALIFAISSASAQTVFAKGDIVANVGVGFNTGITGVVIPPITAGIEYGILDNLIGGKASVGVGGLGSFSRYYKTNIITLAGKGNFHYQFVDKLDTYAGVSIGYSIGYGFYYFGQVGARYYFNEKIAGYAELGGGGVGAGVGAGIELGIAFKL